MTSSAKTAVNPFEGILGQSQVTRFLAQAAAEGRLSHAYLFCGPVGSGKTETALALAKAMLCPAGGCGECDACRRISRRTHPDVHWIDHEGIGAYLAEQIREMTRDCSLAPIAADRKLYVIMRTDLLHGQAANAFLKTLEEPPEDTSFVLIARNREVVMPTLASRCQTLVFRRLPDQEAIGLVRRQAAASAEEAAMALAAVGGSTRRACEFLESVASREMRLAAIAAMERIAEADARDVLDSARSLMSAVEGPQREMKKRFAENRGSYEEFMSKGALAYMDRQQDRKLKNSTKEGLDCILCVISSWLRDCLLTSIGMGDAKVNVDCHYTIERTGQTVDLRSILLAQSAVDRARGRISANVTPQLVLETMLFDIREVLHANRGSG